jgi:hypothetical protein
MTVRVGIHNVRFDFPGAPGSIAPTLAATARAAEQVGSDDDGPFHGRHHQLAETICEPRPITAPFPPILVTVVDLMPTGDPVAYVEPVGRDIIPRLGELDPPG